MTKIKKRLARKAVRSTAKHTVRGSASKLKRDPARAVALLGIGAVLGACAARQLGRGSDSSGSTASAT
ncbi:MAG TPA: hypothetical protein VGC49_03665 [Solirubrobacterales bacterium]|jgi:hypothetical protein